MDIKKIVEQDNQKAIDSQNINKKQRKVIKDYKNIIELGERLCNKLALNKSYRNEVHKFFIDNGFEKSDKNYEGNTIISPSITNYKCQNTWIEISFSEYSETEDVIQVIRPIAKEYYTLTYKLDDNIESMLNSKIIKVNNDILHNSNFKEVILKCNSIEELTRIETLIKENTEDIEDKLTKDIDIVYVYQLKDGRKFTTFADAFAEL